MEATATIGRLRLRAAAADVTALQMRSAAALRALDLSPPAMPAQAILCIRSMGDPFPGGIDARSSHAPRAWEWEQAARRAIVDFFRRAARPAKEGVPGDSPAVLFADRAELLACAIRSAAAGALGSEWWWKHLLAAPTAAAVVRECHRDPTYVPAAVELVAQAGELGVLPRVISRPEAVDLVTVLLRAHAVDGFATTADGLRSAAPVEDSTGAEAEEGMGRTSSRGVPWREIAPEIAAGVLPEEHRVLVAVALVLRRRPSLARSPTFARSLRDLVADVRRIDVPPALAGVPASPGEPQRPDGPIGAVVRPSATSSRSGRRARPLDSRRPEFWSRHAASGRRKEDDRLFGRKGLSASRPRARSGETSAPAGSARIASIGRPRRLPAGRSRSFPRTTCPQPSSSRRSVSIASSSRSAPARSFF